MVRRVEAPGCVHPLHSEGNESFVLLIIKLTVPEKEIEGKRRNEDEVYIYIEKSNFENVGGGERKERGAL